MTTAIVDSFTRDELSDASIRRDVTVYEFNDADLTTRVNQNETGQLWERIAEATPKILGPAYTQRLMGATLNAYIRSGERQSILYGLTSIDDE